MRLIDGDDLAYRIANWDVHDTIHRALQPNERAAFEMTKGDLYGMVVNAPTVATPKAVWEYHNDDHGVWWCCGNCGKIIHKPPNDKVFCSSCGAAMTREA